ATAVLRPSAAWVRSGAGWRRSTRTIRASCCRWIPSGRCNRASPICTSSTLSRPAAAQRPTRCSSTCTTALRRPSRRPTASLADGFRCGRVLFGAPLADGRGRRRDVLFAGAAEVQRLRRAPDQGDELVVPPPLVRLAVQELHRARARPRPVIRPVGGDGVVDVGELKDLRGYRKSRSLQAVRISAAVELLVVPAEDGQEMAEALERLADALPDDGVLVHHDPFLVRQPPRLVDDLVGDPDLTDVVQDPALAQR